MPGLAISSRQVDATTSPWFRQFRKAKPHSSIEIDLTAWIPKERSFEQRQNTKTRDNLQTIQEMVMFEYLWICLTRFNFSKGLIWILPDVLAEVNSDTVHQFLISHLGVEVLNHTGCQVPGSKHWNVKSEQLSGWSLGPLKCVSIVFGLLQPKQLHQWFLFVSMFNVLVWSWKISILRTAINSNKNPKTVLSWLSSRWHRTRSSQFLSVFRKDFGTLHSRQTWQWQLPLLDRTTSSTGASWGQNFQRKKDCADKICARPPVHWKCFLLTPLSRDTTLFCTPLFSSLFSTLFFSSLLFSPLVFSALLCSTFLYSTLLFSNRLLLSLLCPALHKE